MKANELRIGNWVLNNSKLFQIRDGEDIDDQAHFKCYDHIPLSEEWLIKFGFEEGYRLEDEVNFTKELPKGKIKFQINDKGQLAFVWGGLGPGEYYGMPVDCKYVHQLQNLYFALTGEELDLK